MWALSVLNCHKFCLSCLSCQTNTSQGYPFFEQLLPQYPVLTWSRGVGGRGEGGWQPHGPEPPTWDANGLEDKEYILGKENEEEHEEIE